MKELPARVWLFVPERLEEVTQSTARWREPAAVVRGKSEPRFEPYVEAARVRRVIDWILKSESDGFKLKPTGIARELERLCFEE